jgi:hypothetical protein
MKIDLICASFVCVGVACCAGTGAAGAVGARRDPPQQHSIADTKGTRSDPLQQVANGFPRSIKLNEKRRTLEFCPDNTCDGFVSSASVPVAELKDFAYLYIYYFSNFIYLPDWRSHAEAKNAAERVLSKPEYRGCERESDRETARCVLLDHSRGGRIKLIFVRYDENQRNVVPEDIVKELSEKPSPQKQ